LYVVTYPFIIENLAYRYDALSMGLSFLACCIPFLMRERSYTFIFASVACIYFSLLTYQSSLFVYILICMALCAKSIIDENKVPFKHIIECIISVVLAMALAKITWHLKDADFHGRDALFVSAQNPVQALEVNFRSFYDLLTRVYGYSYLKLIFPIILSAVGFIIFGAINFICNKQYKRLSLAIFLVPIFGLMVLLSPGLNLFLAKPFWTARTMMCLVVIFYLVIMLADRLLSRHRNIKKIIFSFPLIYSFALM
ncbi:glucosyltransferase domain-containing protein, partial [Escherichia coli]